MLGLNLFVVNVMEKRDVLNVCFSFIIWIALQILLNAMDI